MKKYYLYESFSSTQIRAANFNLQLWLTKLNLDITQLPFTLFLCVQNVIFILQAMFNLWLLYKWGNKKALNSTSPTMTVSVTCFSFVRAFIIVKCFFSKGILYLSYDTHLVKNRSKQKWGNPQANIHPVLMLYGPYLVGSNRGKFK